MRFKQFLEGLKDMKGKYDKDELMKIVIKVFQYGNVMDGDKEHVEKEIQKWGGTVVHISEDGTTYTIVATEYDMLQVLEYAIYDEDYKKAQQAFNMYAEPVKAPEGKPTMS